MITTIALLTISPNPYAQNIEYKNSMIEGFVFGCKKRKDLKTALEQFGRIQGEKIIDSYCKCMANFFVNNTTLKQAEQIYFGKEKMPEALFQKMEHECTKQLDSLMKWRLAQRKAQIMKQDRFGIGFILICGVFLNLILSFATHALINEEAFARALGGGLGMGVAAVITNHFFPKYGAVTIFILTVFIKTSQIG